VGGVVEFLRRRAAAAGQPPATPAKPVMTGASSTVGPSAGTSSTSRAAAASASPPARSGGELRAARKELTKLERAIDRLGRREQELHLALAEAATDHQRLLALDAELRGVVADKAKAEDAWLTLADDLESTP
nr:ABC transporter C-terminal domain-containing protein [Micromonospora sp. DSM 115978]